MALPGSQTQPSCSRRARRRVTRASDGGFLGVLRLPRNDSALGAVLNAKAYSCHPEPAETAKDPSRDNDVTRMIERSVGNPDTTIPLAVRLEVAMIGLMAHTPLPSIDLPGIPKLRSGKVREVFDLGETLLFVVTD